MENQTYIVATIKSWNIKVYNDVIKKYPGKWYLITDPQDLTVERLKAIKPKYVFFPHWSQVVPKVIINTATCICFHETDLPYGRGGSPVQNLISQGHRTTFISALKMTEELDAGPIYMKKSLSLEGLAEEVFIRSAYIIADMIEEIITKTPTPKKQVGEPTYFQRKTPKESEITQDLKSLRELFDHIRMLDAETYPKAFIEKNGFRYEISRPALKTHEILADVRISRIGNYDND